MIKIRVYYRTFTKNGRNYKILYTTAFGYSCSIQLNGNSKNGLNTQDMTLQSDPRYAEIKFNQIGYMVLCIVDEKSAGYKI